jgi:hypothetical protein
MIVHPIPHNARFISPSIEFQACYDTGFDGEYSFNIGGNLCKIVCALDINTAYLINTIQVSGNIPSEEFTDSIKEFPLLRLRRLIGNEQVHPEAVPVMNYCEQKELAVWVYTNKGSDKLVADLTGRLNQTSFLVGKTIVSIVVNFSIYAVDDTYYNNVIRSKVSREFSNRIR